VLLLCFDGEIDRALCDLPPIHGVAKGVAGGGEFIAGEVAMEPIAGNGLYVFLDDGVDGLLCDAAL
jgi:hypothetical protein